MTIDIAALLEPLSPEHPCGENLEYDTEFLELEIVATVKPEQQVGDTIVAAQDPDWRDVAARAARLLMRTRDLRAASKLVQALLRTHGVTGLRDGLVLVHGYLQRYWETVHPGLDPEDDNDPAIRVNTIASLANLAAVVNPLRDAPLVISKVAGPISARTLALAGGNETLAPGVEKVVPSNAEIDAEFASCDLDDLTRVAQAAKQSRELAGAIEGELTERVGAAKSVDLSELIKAIDEVHAIVAPWAARRSARQADVGDPAAGGDDAPTPTAQRTLGRIASRDDVARALDEACRYFEQHEPSSPVPLLLTRAKRWIAMDFMAVLHDLAPDAAQEAEKLRGAAVQRAAQGE